MLDAIFTFEGRLTRLQFLGLGVLFVVGLMVVTLILMMGCTMIASGFLPASESVNDAVATLRAILWIPWLLMTGVELWGGCGLQTRRVRDIGWSPFYVVGGLTAFRYIDMLLENQLGPKIGTAPPFQDPGPVGSWVFLAYILVLLFWPGREPGRELGRAFVDTSPKPPPPDRRPAPSWRPPSSPRSEFGLRGRH